MHTLTHTHLHTCTRWDWQWYKYRMTHVYARAAVNKPRRGAATATRALAGNTRTARRGVAPTTGSRGWKASRSTIAEAAPPPLAPWKRSSSHCCEGDKKKKKASKPWVWRGARRDVFFFVLQPLDHSWFVHVLALLHYDIITAVSVLAGSFWWVWRSFCRRFFFFFSPCLRPCHMPHATKSDGIPDVEFLYISCMCVDGVSFGWQLSSSFFFFLWNKRGADNQHSGYTKIVFWYVDVHRGILGLFNELLIIFRAVCATVDDAPGA